MDVDVQRVSGSLGAEVRGLALAGCDEAMATTIHELLVEHQVLFFPDQHLTPDEHLAFGRHFGELEAHPNLAFDSERPEFFELRAVDGTGGVADEWHSDITFKEQPSKFAILHMKVCPEVGGDTLWTSTYAAYEHLAPPMQEMLLGLRAMHTAEAHHHPEQRYIHPVVRLHPETGRRALFVNEHFTRRIVELSDAESRMLLDFLTRWVQQPRFGLRYRWRAGTIAMWDNRCTQHHVLDDFVGERVIQRCTVMGDVVEAACPDRLHPPHTSQIASYYRDTPMREQLRAQGLR